MKNVNPLKGFVGFDTENNVDHTEDGNVKQFVMRVPLWLPLLLLLIAPLRWMIARPAGGPAFPMVADVKGMPQNEK